MAEHEPIVTTPARLVAGCHCGKVAAVPCTTLADMRGGMAAIEGGGWVWHDSVGFACSAACASAAEEAAVIRQGRAQRALFDERTVA